MPRKRRKAVITETTPDIPFQKVRVEWVDCVSDSGWASEKEFDKMRRQTNTLRCLHLMIKMKMELLLEIGR